MNSFSYNQPARHRESLETLRLTGAFSPEQLRLRSRQVMLRLSHVIEDVAATTTQTTLIATFQRLSLFLPQLARYQSLTANFAHTYLIGVPDVSVPSLPNVTVIPIQPNWPLVHEWVVLASGPACCVALFARDLAEQQPHERSRAFAGRWTTQPSEVDQIAMQFGHALGQLWQPPKRDVRTLEPIHAALRQGLQQKEYFTYRSR